MRDHCTYRRKHPSSLWEAKRVWSIVSKDREHFRRIAAIEAELNEEAVPAALRTPGENIALGLELSEFAAAFGGDVTHEDEVPLIHLWRAREQRDQNQQ